MIRILVEMAIDASTNIRSSMKNLLLLATLVSIPALAQEESIELSSILKQQSRHLTALPIKPFPHLAQLQLIEYGLQQLLETDAPPYHHVAKTQFLPEFIFFADETAQSAYTLELSKSIPLSSGRML